MKWAYSWYANMVVKFRKRLNKETARRPRSKQEQEEERQAWKIQALGGAGGKRPRGAGEETKGDEEKTKKQTKKKKKKTAALMMEILKAMQRPSSGDEEETDTDSSSGGKVAGVPNTTHTQTHTRVQSWWLNFRTFSGIAFQEGPCYKKTGLGRCAGGQCKGQEQDG